MAWNKTFKKLKTTKQHTPTDTKKSSFIWPYGETMTENTVIYLILFYQIKLSSRVPNLN